MTEIEMPSQMQEQPTDIDFSQPRNQRDWHRVRSIFTKPEQRDWLSIFIRSGVPLLIGLICGVAAPQILGFWRTFNYFQNVNFIYYPLWDSQTESMDPTKFGKWVGVVPQENISASWGELLGMQTVHTLLLPSGKVLVASGSSWRNRKNLTDIYPYVLEPRGAVGLFNRQTFKLTGNKQTDDKLLYEYYKLTNNVGIYDPYENTFYRIPHPVPTVYPENNTFQPNDLFCTGHNHLPDGNPLFVGGTQLYYPWRSGHRATYIFDWIQEANTDWKGLKDWGFRSWDEVVRNRDEKVYYPWVDAGLMRTGRWYPSVIPLMNGSMVYMSGFIGEYNNQTMFRYEINKYIQIFDYKKFKAGNKNLTLIDTSNITNSPFNTLLKYPPPKSDCNQPNTDNLDNQTFQRMCNSYKYDAFKLYPQNYLVSQNKIYITQQGDWNSLREQKHCCNRQTNQTFYMNLIRNNSQYTSVSFENGPQRADNVSMSGTSVLYKFTPRNDQADKEKIWLFGGMHMMLSGTYLPGLGSIDDTQYNNVSMGENLQYVGSRGSRKLEVFELDRKMWQQINSSYMGATYQYDRTMHYSILLPTKQILIINGGNYDYSNPIHSPIILTPFFNQTSNSYNFNRTIMAPSRIGKLYHNTAVLLRDGSVLTSGGNSARAVVDADAEIVNRDRATSGQYKYNQRQVDLMVFFRNQSTYARQFGGNPAESHRMEIYKPPYMFIEAGRNIILHLSGFQANQTQKLKNKNYYLLRSNKKYGLKVINQNLQKGCKNSSIVLIKLGSPTHGWDSGQKLYILPFETTDHINYKFQIPNARENLIVPAFYHLFYVDCVGKVAESLMVRVDDQAKSVFG